MSISTPKSCLGQIPCATSYPLHFGKESYIIGLRCVGILKITNGYTIWDWYLQVQQLFVVLTNQSDYSTSQTHQNQGNLIQGNSPMSISVTNTNTHITLNLHTLIKVMSVVFCYKASLQNTTEQLGRCFSILVISRHAPNRWLP